MSASAPSLPAFGAAVRTLVARRWSLSVHTPRELFVPLTTPVLFALVIAPALRSIGPKIPGLDYLSFAAIGTAVLLIPLNCMFAGIGVIVDRETGARRDLLTAPVRHSAIVFANMAVALAITALQLVVLLIAAVARGADLHTSFSGGAWFAVTNLGLAIAMYGVAETIANRIHSVEEYIALVPGLAIVPFFFGGALFPISAMPRVLTAFARMLPITHALAVMRYGLLANSNGLHDIWGMSSPALMAALSLAVVAVFAMTLSAVAVRTFGRSSRV
jgi:ABC-2 type transport system permease protein